MSRNSLLIVFVLLFVFVLCVPAVGFAQDDAELDPVSIHVSPFLSYLPIFIAAEEGYFEAQGIDIELVRLGRSTQALGILAQGDVDAVAGILNSGLINAVSRAANLKIVADKGYMAVDGCAASGFFATPSLLAAAAAPDFDLASLTEYPIAVNDVSLEAYFLERYLEDVGVTIADFTNVDVPRSAEVDALMNEAITLLHAGEPAFTEYRNLGLGELFIADKDIVPDGQLAYVTYGERLLVDDPELGERFMVAYLQGVRQYLAGPTERNLELAAAFTGLEQELLETVCWQPMRADGSITFETIADFQAWALEKDLIDEIVATEDLWDASFIEHANAVLGE